MNGSHIKADTFVKECAALLPSNITSLTLALNKAQRWIQWDEEYLRK